MIYFIQAGDNGPVKIGVARHLATRLRNFQIGHYETLRAIRTMAGGRATETWLHQHFSECHIRGEWFRFHAAMLTIQLPDGAVQLPEPSAPSMPRRATPTRRPVVADSLPALQRAIQLAGGQAKLAMAIGRTQQYVSMCLNGKINIHPESALAIDKATGGAVRKEELCPRVFEAAA